MKQLFTALLAGLLLVGCGTSTTTEAPVAVDSQSTEELTEKIEETVKEASENVSIEELVANSGFKADGLTILSPSGAPALSLIPAVLAGANVNFVDGADPLQAALVNPSPEYDVIIAPSNLGLKLAEAGKTSYRMKGVATWGNLYIVAAKGTSNDASTWTNVASFGEQSVTGKVFADVYGDALNMDEVTWYNSTAETSAALLAGEADVAMLAEPNATATIAKAKENGKELEIIDDVQMRFAGTSGIGFPQAAIFVSEAAYAEKKDQIDSMFNLMSDFSMQVHALDADAIAALIEACGGAEKFGVPSAQVVGKVWDRLNINVVDAREHMDELQKFAPLFDIQDVEAALLK